MGKCSKCGVEKEDKKLRRGMCLNCYRKFTGLSGGVSGRDSLIELAKELEKAEQRVKIIKSKIRTLIR